MTTVSGWVRADLSRYAGERGYLSEQGARYLARIAMRLPDGVRLRIILGAVTPFDYQICQLREELSRARHIEVEGEDADVVCRVMSVLREMDQAVAA